MSARDVSFGPRDERRYQHGDLVMSTSEGDDDAIRDDEIQLPFGRVSIALCSGNAGAGESPYLEIRVGQTHRSELDIYPVRDSLGDALVDCSKSHDPNTGSDSSFNVASIWLDECLTSHDFCKQYQGGISKLSTRVIDVGPLDNPKDPSDVTLYVADEGEEGRYLALSHRWDNSERLECSKTTKDSYSVKEEDRKTPRNIPFSSLPLTFQHAITITRKFGYKYIWIDSLCIIQDDTSDWERESQKMADIYRRADFTVASIDAEGRDSGCFSPRDGRGIRPCRIDVARPPTEMDTYGMQAGKIFAFPKIRFDHSRASYRRHSALDDRGWCLQEQALSPRILSYGKDGLYWECVATYASEWSPEGITPDSGSGDNEYIHVLRKEAAGITKEDRNRKFENKHHAWHLLAQDYSRRKLTYDSDKVVALSGIVKNLSEPKKDSCHFGVWEKLLWRDLLWLVYTKNTILKNFHGSWGTFPPMGPPGQRLSLETDIPSWSWMSVHGSVCFQANQFNTPERYSRYSDVSFLHTELAECPRRTVTVTGVLLETRPCCCDGRCDAQYVTKVQNDGIHYPKENKILHLLDGDAGIGCRVAEWFPDVGDDIPATVFCVPIAGTGGPVQCLVVVPVKKDDNMHYRRVGLALWNGRLPAGLREISSYQYRVELPDKEDGDVARSVSTIHIV